MDLLILVLACFRLARLVSKDKITEPLRYQFGRRAAGKRPWSLPWLAAEWINCPHCTGVWFAFFLALLAGRKGLLLRWLAVAGGQSFLEGITP